MRWISLILVILLLLLQYPLWLGKGSWLKVWDIDQQEQP
jgi:cell division protein FtsB